MYTALSKAGRHGAYSTMFARATTTPSQPQPQQAARVAHSRKSIDRRLVLPLDAHNWPRALEVLGARYAQPARRASDYQRVIRDMVEHTMATTAATTGATASASRPSLAPHACAGARARADVLATLDSLRDAAFAGDVPCSVSLWVTFVWAYCALQQPREACTCMAYAQRRCASLSRATRQHMASLVLPLLAQHGCYAEARQVADTELHMTTPSRDNNNSNDSSSGSTRQAAAVTPPCCDVRQLHVCLAEAAARDGQWQRALQHLHALQPLPLSSSTTASHTTAIARDGDDGGTHSSAHASTQQQQQQPSSLLLRASSAATLRSLFVDTPRDDKHGAERNNNNDDDDTAATLYARVHTPAAVVTVATTTATATTAPATLTSRAPTRRHDACAVTAALPSWAALARDVLSTAAQRQLLLAAAHAGQCDVCDACWTALSYPTPAHAHDAVDTRAHTHDRTRTTATTSLPQPVEVHAYMDSLCRAGRWRDVVGLFAVLYLGRHDGVARYVTTTMTAADDNNDDDNNDNKTTTTRLLSLDETVLNMVFTAFPRTHGNDAAAQAQQQQQQQQQRQHAHNDDDGVECIAHAAGVVRLFDDLLRWREDMCVTDYVLATVAPALLQCGDDARALALLQCTSLRTGRMRSHDKNDDDDGASSRRCRRADGAAVAPASPSRQHAVQATSPAQRALHARLARVVYALYTRATLASPVRTRDSDSITSNDDRRTCDSMAVVRAFPQLFPHAQQQQQDDDGAMRSCAATMSSSSHQQQQQPQSPRRRRPWASVRPTTLLTELQERRMQSQFAQLYAQRDALYARMTVAAAEADPRPVPKGLHDYASGWSFVGRNGEMVFANSRRTPHPLRAWPKQMHALGNPYRGWSVWQNSCLAHRENVKKWNGRSSV